MDRPEILVHPRIRQQLGDDTINQALGHLAPGDCQTCNRSLGPDPVALEAEQVGPMVFVRLHHPRCRPSAWVTSGALRSGGDTLSYACQALQLPLGIGDAPGDPGHMTPVLLVHPSLEMAVLRKEGRSWRVSTLDAYASFGLKPVGSILVNYPVPKATATLRGTTVGVQLPPIGQWEGSVFPGMRRAIQDDGGVLLLLTTAIDPDAMQDERAVRSAIATYAVGGWIAVPGRSRPKLH